jgi:pimeloyl-ACP methyl ester carboxylesterase
VLWLPAPASAARARPAARGDFAGLVPLPAEGRSLYLECQGTGRPTIILESGLRNRADVWSEPLEPSGPLPTVFPALAKHTRVCAYDRPGTTLGETLTSRSDPVPMPRTARDVVSDLRMLTRAAGIRPPFVFVSHSTGGLISRLYTSTYPHEVRGLVLVDAIAETMEADLSVSDWNEYNTRYLVNPPPSFATYWNIETIDFPVSFEQMSRRPKPPHRIPLIVLSRSLPFGLPGALGEAVELAWTQSQLFLGRLEPRTPHIIVPGVGHYIQVERPDVVIDAALRMLQAVRTGRRVA